MSEPEFDMYLSLMSKFLRLTSAQKADIAEELRIHLEDRLAELTAQGKSREEAIRLALEEFGDAGALAWQFTIPHHIRRRRLIMRYSVGSFVAVAGIFSLVSLMWPSRQDQPPMGARAVAQAKSEETAAAVPAAQAAVQQTELQRVRREIEEKLEARDHEINFTGTLTDALSFLSEAIDVDFHLDQDLPLDTNVSLIARKGALSVNTTLELLLRQTGDPSVIYVIKDGIILITNSDADYEVQVYDCRDLLAGVMQRTGAMGGGGMGGMGGMGGGGMGGGGMMSIPAELAATALGQFGGGQGGGQPQNAGANPGGQQPAGALGGFTPTGGVGALMMVILKATQPAQWQDQDGSGGTISAFDGLLVVRHNQAVHRKIEEVLEKLRLAKQVQDQQVKKQHAGAPPLVIPPGKRLVTLDANNWQVPANSVKVGSRVDLISTENPESSKPIIIADLEVAVINNGGGFNAGGGGITVIYSLGFLVTPEKALELKQAEKNGVPQFLLRGEGEEKAKTSEKDAGVAPVRMEIPPGKRLVTLEVKDLEVPLSSLQTGACTDILRYSDSTHQWELVFSDLEIATVNGIERVTYLERFPNPNLSAEIWKLGFIVTPELALKINDAEETTSRALRFLVHGKGGDTHDSPKRSTSSVTVPVIPAEKRLMTLDASQWPIQVQAIKSNSRLDVYKKNEKGIFEIVCTNLEIAALESQPVKETTEQGEPATAWQIRNITVRVPDYQAEQLAAISQPGPYLLLGEELKRPGYGGASVTEPSLVSIAAQAFASLPEPGQENMRVTVENATPQFGESRFYPLIGPARLMKSRFKCRMIGENNERMLVVHVDEDRLIHGQ